MVKKLDILITGQINQFAINSRIISVFLKIITHTSSGKAYPLYANLLPVIGKNMGWEFINPFTGSLEDYFNNSLS